jgi:hypothetical protein
MTAQKITILARTCVPVRLGAASASGQRHTPISSGIKSVKAVGMPD